MSKLFFIIIINFKIYKIKFINIFLLFIIIFILLKFKKYNNIFG